MASFCFYICAENIYTWGVVRLDLGGEVHDKSCIYIHNLHPAPEEALVKGAMCWIICKTGDILNSQGHYIYVPLILIVDTEYVYIYSAYL